MMRPGFVALAALAFAACSPSPAPAVSSNASTPAPPAAAAADGLAADLARPHPAGEKGVYIVNLRDGDEVTSPFRVVFGLYGMGVAPAGIEKENTGHHHLLIDTTMTAEEMTFAIPNDDKHRHYGAGQTEAEITLPPGRHTLQLMLGDKGHVPLVPPLMSQPITITVR